jgi:hypothetical protein
MARSLSLLQRWPIRPHPIGFLGCREDMPRKAAFVTKKDFMPSAASIPCRCSEKCNSGIHCYNISGPRFRCARRDARIRS